MNLGKKISIIFTLIISMVVIVGNFHIVNAETVNTDCNSFANGMFSQEGGKNGFEIINKVWNISDNPYSNFLTIDQQLSIIDSESLNTAMLNLKKYCCEQGLGNLNMESNICKKDKMFFNDNALDSPYLFDHIFDVMMRRLNGLSGSEDIYTKTNMTVDKTGEEWRGWITEKAEDLSGTLPETIYNKYKKFWIGTEENMYIKSKIDDKFANQDSDFLLYVSGNGGDENSESKKIAKALQNYSQRSLYDKYYNSCAISKYLYSLLNQGYSSDKNQILKRISDGSCDKIIQQQIEGENEYVSRVIQETSNRFLSNYFQGYLSYLYDRLDTLKGTRSNATDRFLAVARAVPQLIKECTH